MSYKRRKSKLSEEDIQKIKEYLSDERGIRQVWIAKQFGVCQSTIAFYNQKLKEESCQENFQTQA